jgi:predicted AAA+ superfamily ATPase
MMNIRREIQPILERMAAQFPIVAIIGPRQSGKTTLAKMTFPDYTYVTLEDLDRRRIAIEDPRQFLAAFGQGKGLIIDEIQHVPDLFSYLQTIVDEAYRPGRFIITGSQNFALLASISQSLAGRVTLLTLLPLTVDELQQAHLLAPTLEENLIKGFYPRIYAQPIDPEVWIRDYISNYVERDARQLLKISNLLSFQKFIALCAARIGCILNFADLARDADVSPNTIKAWFSILEASYIVYQLVPHYTNYSKRLIQTPKLYFYDTGLACSLLGIQSAQELFEHPMRGNIFESFAITEMFKYRYNSHKKPHLFFWRDAQQHEVDCVFEKRYNTLIPVEIKASMTFNKALLKSLSQWQEIANLKNTPAYLIYAGDTNLNYMHYRIYTWNSIKTVVQKLDE